MNITTYIILYILIGMIYSIIMSICNAKRINETLTLQEVLLSFDFYINTIIWIYLLPIMIVYTIILFAKKIVDKIPPIYLVKHKKDNV